MTKMARAMKRILTLIKPPIPCNFVAFECEMRHATKIVKAKTFSIYM
jgi:hypothetical protein